MPLNNCKVEFKLNRTKYCVLAAADADDGNADSDNITFTIKDIKLYFPLVTLSAKENQMISKLLNKVF